MSWFSQKLAPGLALTTDPITLMGNVTIEPEVDDFHLVDSGDLEMKSLTSTSEIPNLMELWSKIPWLTYRRDFPPIGDSGWTTDAGWGCLLRSGQMMLVHTLLRQRLAEGRWEARPEVAQAVLADFADRPESPYSIHRIALAGAKCGKSIGQWFAPSTFGLALEHVIADLDTKEIGVYCPLDGVIYVDRLPSPVTGPDFAPVLIFLPLRLGIDNVADTYFPIIKRFFSLAASVGIVGGRPGASLYFVGYQGDNLLYFDPHTVQAAGQPSPAPSPLLLPLTAVDPSLAFGFHIESREAWDLFRTQLAELNRTGPPLFAVEENYPEDDESSGLEGWE